MKVKQALDVYKEDLQKGVDGLQNLQNPDSENYQKTFKNIEETESLLSVFRQV